MTERRLTQHPDGSVTGGFVAKSDEKLKEKLSIHSSVAEAISAGLHVTTGQLSISNSVPPLTAEQRLSELKKKIAEYRSLLNVATDATTRGLVDLFLVNISKDLGEIEVELKKKPVQGPIQTSPAFPPYQPGLGPWYDPMNPGVCPPLVGPTWVGHPKTPDLDWTTTCVGKTCVTYPGKVEALSQTTLTLPYTAEVVKG
jgi:hypothetical protein